MSDGLRALLEDHEWIRGDNESRAIAASGFWERD